MRTREHIEGDLKAAERAVAALTEELAATPPATLKIKTIFNNSITLDRYGSDSAAFIRVDNGASRGIEAKQARQIVDYLNYHLLKENA